MMLATGQDWSGHQNTRVIPFEIESCAVHYGIDEDMIARLVDEIHMLYPALRDVFIDNTPITEWAYSVNRSGTTSTAQTVFTAMFEDEIEFIDDYELLMAETFETHPLASFSMTIEIGEVRSGSMPKLEWHDFEYDSLDVSDISE